MTLIQSVSGIRGTIGGAAGNNLTPTDAVRFVSAYGHWLQHRHPQPHLSVVIGRDARPSGPMISNLVSQTLIGMGIQVIDLGLSTTPTVEMAVPFYAAQGGIILTASHNPVEWNALKLLNEKGEFLSAEDGQALLDIDPSDILYASVQALGSIHQPGDFIDHHIDAILKHPLVNVDAIRKARFRVSVNGVHSSGGVAVPKLLEKLGAIYIHNPYGEPSGKFPHNPEPLPEHLTTYCEMVKNESVNLGIVVDPDVDRLALVDENGDFFGEENTLVAIADYVLGIRPGPKFILKPSPKRHCQKTWMPTLYIGRRRSACGGQNERSGRRFGWRRQRRSYFARFALRPRRSGRHCPAAVAHGGKSGSLVGPQSHVPRIHYGKIEGAGRTSLEHPRNTGNFG